MQNADKRVLNPLIQGFYKSCQGIIRTRIVCLNISLRHIVEHVTILVNINEKGTVEMMFLKLFA